MDLQKKFNADSKTEKENLKGWGKQETYSQKRPGQTRHATMHY